MLNSLFFDINNLSKIEFAENYKRFFKTNKGEYAENDCFIGISVPNIRILVKKYYPKLSFKDLETLIQSQIHEHRLYSLLYMVKMFHDKKYITYRNQIYQVYIDNISHVNNWDLVDSSAHYIIGAYVENKNKNILYQLAYTDSLWENRIAVISCFWFIKKNDFSIFFEIALILLNHKHDLIHKAIGWMLREVGKMNFEAEFDFLKQNYLQMPRTMLRYAIERFDEQLRTDFLKARI